MFSSRFRTGIFITFLVFLFLTQINLKNFEIRFKNFDKIWFLWVSILFLSTLINQIELIDKYENKLTLRITFHDKNKQLTKEDISAIREQINNLR